MTRKTKIDTDAGPTLFDTTPQDPTAEDQGATPQANDADTDQWAEILKTAEDLRRDAERAGVWVLIPTETLLRRGELYYNQRVDKIRETMAGTGATTDVIEVVCTDYAGVLSGQFKFKATPEQMQAALLSLKPFVAYSIDRYGLYFGLLVNYSRFLLRFREYVEDIKGEGATEETKRAYITGFWPAMDARAVRWLLNIGVFQPTDFAGFDPAEMNIFFGRIAEFAALGEFTLYYTVARAALLATPDELTGVDAPPFLNTQTPITKFCEQVLQETVENLNRAGEKFAEAVTSETTTEQEQARQAGKDWHDDTNAQPVKIHQNYGIVLSRPVNVSPDGKTITRTFPIKRYIDDFNEHPVRFGKIQDYGKVTEQSVQRVFEGLNLLPQYLNGQMTVEGGKYTFRTNLSEFSEICGYADAGQAEQRALLGGLLVLRNLWFVVNRPYRYAEYLDSRGRTRRKQVGGPVAMQFVNLREIGLQSGDLLIEIFPESLRGKPTLMTAAKYKQMRGKAKSTTQSRFNHQIATKSHKSERDLIDEVFGLRDMLEHAEGAEDLQRVKTYAQNHRPAFRKKVLAWFDEYVRDGILTEYKREPSKTDKRDFVLSWVCPDASKLTPPPFDPDTDETAAEIDDQ